MSPQRIQRKRTKGWRMPEGAIYVGRPTKWGNPFAAQRVTNPEYIDYDWFVDDGFEVEFFTAKPDAIAYTVELFEVQVQANRVTDPRPHRGLHELVGHDLACWCRLDQPCHADVLLKLANGGAL